MYDRIDQNRVDGENYCNDTVAPSENLVSNAKKARVQIRTLVFKGNGEM